MRTKLIIILIIIASIVSTGVVVLYKLQYWEVKEEKIFLIEKGESTATIISNLYREKLISGPLIGRVLAYRLAANKKYLQPGEYKIDKGLRGAEVLNKITSGERMSRRITIPEGLSVKQVIEIIEATYGLKGDIGIMPPEGYLMPETYVYYYGDEKSSIINRMQHDMEVFLRVVQSTEDIRTLLTIASIVEKETRLEDERPLVASVFLNRLKLGMPLQADPTVLYGITNGYGTLNRIVTPDDLKVDTPYNTYLHKGLPPTPICNPGKAAIRSVANPAKTNYLYFVADGAGGHKFANSYAEHVRNILTLKRLLKARAK